MRAVVEADADGADGPSLPDVSLLVAQDGGAEHAPSPEELLAEKLSTIDASILAEAMLQRSRACWRVWTRSGSSMCWAWQAAILAASS